jgi:hypothetical protein
MRLPNIAITKIGYSSGTGSVVWVMTHLNGKRSVSFSNFPSFFSNWLADEVGFNYTVIKLQLNNITELEWKL